MGNDVCSKCGGALRLEDKHTFTSREFREYRCDRCGEQVVEDRGIALWQLLHDANEEAQEVRREREARRPWWRIWKK